MTFKLPSLPVFDLSLVFYVDSNTKGLVKPKNHIFPNGCWVSSEITDEPQINFTGFNKEAIGNWLSTDYELKASITQTLRESKALFLSFSKYPVYYYPYLSIASDLIVVELQESEYEEVYPYASMPYIGDDFILKGEYCIPILTGVGQDDNIQWYRNINCFYQAPVHPLAPSIPKFFDLELTKKCSILQVEDVIYLYVNNNLCGAKMEDKWFFIQNSEILQPPCVRDFNKLTRRCEYEITHDENELTSNIIPGIRHSILRRYLLAILQII